MYDAKLLPTFPQGARFYALCMEIVLGWWFSLQPINYWAQFAIQYRVCAGVRVCDANETGRSTPF